MIERKAAFQRKKLIDTLLRAPSSKCPKCKLISPKIRSNQWHTMVMQAPLSKSAETDFHTKGGLSSLILDESEGEEDDEALGMDIDPDEDDFVMDVEESVMTKKNRLLLPIEVEKLFNLLWNGPDARLLKGLFKRSFGGNFEANETYQAFFLHNMVVPPLKYRPPPLHDSAMVHPLNSVLTRTVENNNQLLKLVPAEGSFDEYAKEFQDLAVSLQNLINSYLSTSSSQSDFGHKGIKNLLDKKEGLFRRNMMGKRVNYSCRSVIAPDPYISTDEVGIPDRFAKVLTFPTPVTPYNVEVLRQSVVNGSGVHPGANFIEVNGVQTSLAKKKLDERIALSKTLLSGEDKIVYRHLNDGDAVLLNRQPTLHKPGIMAHKVRVLKGEQTIRMHYANCNTYNADFDGDEMNVHFPQDQVARSEAYLLAGAPHQYIVPKDGTPLRGLIQDHIVGGVLLTKKDTFFSKQQYNQFLFVSCTHLRGDKPILTLPPAILRPQPLWTGKQIISSLLLNLTHQDGVKAKGLFMEGKSRIPVDCWGSHKLEGKILMRNGELLHGVMDKAQFGASSYGIVHCVYEIYGAEASEKMLTSVARLCTHFIQSRRGFTCGVDDLLLHENADKMRTGSIHGAKKRSVVSSAEFVEDLLPENFLSGKKLDAELVAEALRHKFQLNSEDYSDLSKALDNHVKSSLNQLTSEIIKKSLDPSSKTATWKRFPLNNLSLMTMSGAKGSNVNLSQISCLLGQQELEGRRVPRTPVGRTLPSFSCFDVSARAGGFITDRFLTGIRPQEYYFHCMAGREGLVDTAVKTSRSGYLQRCLVKHLENISVHYDYTVRDSARDGQVIQFLYGEDSVDVMKTAFLYNESKFDFLQDNYQSLLRQLNPRGALQVLDLESASKIWFDNVKSDESILSKLNPSRCLGAVSENFQAMITRHMQEHGHDDKFQAMMWMKYLQSLVHPGEAVGVLAAQSIGEPSTQMTLNTFHLAGFGGANVTLGIPRLRELIMTAAKSISTPLMQIFFRSRGGDESAAKELSNKLKKVCISDLSSGVVMKERVDKKTKVVMIQVKIELSPELVKQFEISPTRLENVVKESLIPILLESSREEVIVEKKKPSDEDEVVQNDMVGVEISTESEVPIADDASEGRDSDEESSDKSFENGDDDEVSAESIDKNSLVDQSELEKAMLNVRGSRDPSVSGIRLTSESIEIDFVMDLYLGRCLLGVSSIAKCLEKCVIREVKGISGCYIVQPGVGAGSHTPKEYALQTEGINFHAISRLAGNDDFDIDLNRLRTNDVYSILKNYGVEAARNSIVREISSVFAVYGISVDHRHLSLLADYMTVDGEYRALNRYGIADSTSPLLKMSFETCTGFLKQAILTGEKDVVSTVSSRIVVGDIMPFGTGSFDLVQPLTL